MTGGPGRRFDGARTMLHENSLGPPLRYPCIGPPLCAPANPRDLTAACAAREPPSLAQSPGECARGGRCRCSLRSCKDPAVAARHARFQGPLRAFPHRLQAVANVDYDARKTSCRQVSTRRWSRACASSSASCSSSGFGELYSADRYSRDDARSVGIRSDYPSTVIAKNGAVDW